MDAAPIGWTRLDQLPEVTTVAEASSPAMTVRDVAAYLSVNEKTVYRLAQRGELPGFKVAGAWRFRPEDLEGWVQNQKVEPNGGVAQR